MIRAYNIASLFSFVMQKEASFGHNKTEKQQRTQEYITIISENDKLIDSASIWPYSVRQLRMNIYNVGGNSVRHALFHFVACYLND